MYTHDYVIDIVLSIFLILGGYQFYFYCQRHPWRAPIVLRSGLDNLLPLWPTWVWIYVGVYFPALLSVNFIVTSPRQFTTIAMSYFCLLFIQMAFFLLLPVRLPPSWRGRNPRRTLSERFLTFVCAVDAESNCFPSMHCSVAMLTALHMQQRFGNAVWALPGLVGLSSLLTKQHYIVDVPAGLVLGWVVFYFYSLA